MAVYSANVQEAAATGVFRLVGGGYSFGAFASGPFSGLGDENRYVSSDLFSTNTVVNSSFADSALAVSPVVRLVNNIFGITVPESGAAVDQNNSAVTFVSQVDDAVTAKDENVVFLTVNRDIGETVTASYANSSIPTYSANIIEAAQVIRVQRLIGLGFSTGGFASGPYSGLGDGFSEFGGDIFSANINVNKAFSELVRASSTFIGRTIFPASFDDASVISLQTTIFLTVDRDIAESATGTYVNSSIPEYAVSFQDTVTGSVQGSTLVEFGVSTSDIALALDAPFSNFTVNAAVIDTVSGLDRPFTQYITRPVVADMAQATDISTVRLQWENIDTFDPTVWTLINTNE